MKILHTSDWHLGRTTYNEPRAQDHDTVIAEIIRIAHEHKPELIIHSGDLFDRPVPAPVDMERAVDALNELSAVAPVVVVCGNHDSPQLFTVFNKLLGPNRQIHLAGRPQAPADGGVLRYPGADGTVLRIAVLPFIHANRMVHAFDDPHQWRGDYARRVGNMEQALAAELARDLDPRREVTVFAAHLYVGGARFAHSERPVHTTDYYATDAAAIPAVGYAAFGHIHKPQQIPHTKVVGRYAGSPIQMDFGELDEAKSVVMVDLRPGHPADVEIIGLSGGRQLRRLEGTFSELQQLAETVDDDLCLVTVQTPSHQPDASEQVRALFPRATILQITEAAADQKLEIVTPDTVSTDAEPELDEMLAEYLTRTPTTTAPAERVLASFKDILDSLNEGRPPTFANDEALMDGPEPASHDQRTEPQS